MNLKSSISTKFCFILIFFSFKRCFNSLNLKTLNINIPDKLKKKMGKNSGARKAFSSYIKDQCSQDNTLLYESTQCHNLNKSFNFTNHFFAHSSKKKQYTHYSSPKSNYITEKNNKTQNFCNGCRKTSLQFVSPLLQNIYQSSKISSLSISNYHLSRRQVFQ